MKIGILTHYQVHNHGAILQMHGLYNTLKILGWEPCILTYRKDFSFISQSLVKKYNLSLYSIPFYFKELLNKGFFYMLFQLYKGYKLKYFKKQHYIFSPLYFTDLDAVVIGSDEVFSLEVGVNIMMYGHTVNCKNIFSYAASFGQTDINRINEKNCSSLITSGLKTLKSICVRDLSSANTVEKLTGIKPNICFDPVLLYGFEKEIQNTTYSLPKKPYIIVYAYSNRLNTEEEIIPIKNFAKKHGMKIISPGFYHRWVDKNINLDPFELLKIIQGAEFVITDTFHGCVLSTLVNTEFVVCIRDSNINKISFLLDSLYLSDRKIKNFSMLENCFANKTDWEKTNKQINNLRIEGFNYLKGALYGEK